MTKFSTGLKIVTATVALAMTSQVGTVFAASSNSTSAPAPAQSSSSSSSNGTLDFNATPVGTSNINSSIKSYFFDKAQAGGTLKEKLAITDMSSSPESINFSTVDASTGVNGGVIFGSSASKKTWITGLPSNLTVAPGQTKDVAFTVNVPSSAKAGDYTFGLSMEDHPASSMSASKNKKFSVQLKRQIRRVVAMEVEVPGQKTGTANITGAKLLTYPSGVFIDIIGNNTNNFLTKYNGTISIQAGNGKPTTFKVNQAELVPNGPFNFRYKWMSGHPSVGKYNVTVKMTDGHDKVDKTVSFSIKAKQLQKAQQLTGQKMVSSGSSFPSWIMYAGGALILVIFGLLLFLINLLRKKK